MITVTIEMDKKDITVICDATVWFEQATDEQIKELNDSGWSYDQPLDDVAHYMASHDEKVDTFFECHELINQLADWIELDVESIGFGCRIDQIEAMKWIKTNKPELFQSIA